MRWLACAAAVALSTSCGLPALASSLFEGDDEGWQLSGNGAQTRVELRKDGGNPNGNICGKDAQDGDTWYFVAPGKYLGNVTAAYGKRLIFDLKQYTYFNQIRGRDVVLNGGGLAVTWYSRYAPGLEWTPYSVTLDDQSGWVVDEPTGHGPPATADDLKRVLGNLTALRLRGEFYDGPNDVACLDNVYFGTP